MRSLAHAALLSLALAALCISAGCTIPFFGQEETDTTTPVINVGIRPYQPPDTRLTMTLNESIAGMKEHLAGFGNEDGKNPAAITGDVRIYYIQAADIDATGRASHWIFGVNNTMGQAVIVSDETGWHSTLWNGTLPSREILVTKILPPEQLLVQNSEKIAQVPATGSENRELDLRDNIYSLTIVTPGSVRILNFDAISGKPVGIR